MVLPGTVANFGPDALDNPGVAAAPQNPVTRKGAIRVRMEAQLRKAAEAGAPALIVRCGDFFGPNAANNWFLSQGLVKPSRPVSAISYLERARSGTNGPTCSMSARPSPGWSTARTSCRLRGLSHGGPLGCRRDVHDRVDPARLATAAVRAFPWWAVVLASPSSLFGEMREMRYLWARTAA